MKRYFYKWEYPPSFNICSRISLAFGYPSSISWMDISFSACRCYFHSKSPYFLFERLYNCFGEIIKPFGYVNIFQFYSILASCPCVINSAINLAPFTISPIFAYSRTEWTTYIPHETTAHGIPCCIIVFPTLPPKVLPNFGSIPRVRQASAKWTATGASGSRWKALTWRRCVK